MIAVSNGAKDFSFENAWGGAIRTCFEVYQRSYDPDGYMA